jgi:catechol 2,3-dioxygenase-like lactoylglutathione lyase family enzyme
VSVQVLFAGIATADLATTRPWYERVLGGPPDMLPHPGEAAWRVTGSAWIYVVEDPGRAGRTLITLIVDDLDERLERLAAEDIETSAIETVGDGTMRRASVTDPDGNRITFGQPG